MRPTFAAVHVGELAQRLRSIAADLQGLYPFMSVQIRDASNVLEQMQVAGQQAEAAGSAETFAAYLAAVVERAEKAETLAAERGKWAAKCETRVMELESLLRLSRDGSDEAQKNYLNSEQRARKAEADLAALRAAVDNYLDSEGRRDERGLIVRGWYRDRLFALLSRAQKETR